MMTIVGGDHDEEVHIIHLDEFEKKIKAESGMDSKEFISKLLWIPGGKEEILAVAQKIWGPKTHSYTTTAGKKKVVCFITIILTDRHTTTLYLTML